MALARHQKERQNAFGSVTAWRVSRSGSLTTYPGFSHGMLTVDADVLNADLLAFVTH
ncbi:MAG: hypothetical protein KF735_03020 [Chelatococcus sp.]|nr:hypothetical protein [Chelatococcus sp.]